MQFAFTDEQAMIADSAAHFFAEHATSARTRLAMASPDGIDRALWRGFAADLGFAGIGLPEAHGGAGLGMIELAIVAEAAGRHVAALPLLSSIGLAAQAIAAGASDEVRNAVLPDLARGERIAAFAAPDACGAGSPTSLVWRGARLEGVASVVPHGAAADMFVLAVQGRLALLPRATPGLTVTPLVSMDQTRPSARLDFDMVTVTPFPDDARALESTLLRGWVMIAADALGGAQACLDRTTAHARDRVQFARPIAGFQAVKHRLADMMVLVEQARSAVYWAACAIDEATEDRMLAAHAAKAFATDAYARCAGAMLQLHGGIGFTWEHDAHLFLKRARADLTWLGTPAWHRERVAVLAGLGEAA